MSRRRGQGTGTTRQLPSGSIRAEFRAPDGTRPSMTFRTQQQADLWLAAQQVDVARGLWQPKRSAAPLFGAYAADWIATRRNRRGEPLAPRTAQGYRDHLRLHLAALATVPIDEITPAMIRALYAALDGRPAAQANAYGLLAAVLHSAVEDQIIDRSPARIRGGMSKVRAAEVTVLTPAEVVALADAMPAHLRALVLLTVFDTLRQGEAFELRRGDVAPDCSTVRIARGVTHTKGERHVRGPKSEAGKRLAAVPPHLRPILAEHLRLWAEPGADALVFTSTRGNQLRASTLYRHFYAARAQIGRPDLRWHDLRHTGATMAAQTGATLGELMALLGHATVGAAMIYQHMVDGRRDELAARMSQLADAGRPDLRVVGGQP